MQLRVSKNADELSRLVAEWLVAYISKELEKEEIFTLALSGGSTPAKLYQLLAGDSYKNKIDWRRIHIFWGDERFVPFSDERNNAAMAFKILLNHVPVAEENIHAMQTENISPQDAAIAYEKILKTYFTQSQTFSLVLLGMGDDGHTLSLFPGNSELIHEKNKWCSCLWLPSQNMYRITLTAPAVNASSCVAFYATGAGKAQTLKEVLHGPYQPEKFPSQIIQPVNGELIWFLDEAAAALL